MSVFLLCVSVASAAVFLYLRGRKQATLPYPPGPTPRLFVGNLYDAPKSKPWKTYYEWSKMYGSGLVHFQVNSQHTVIINTQDLSDRMLEKRARVYSDRPYIPMADLLGWGRINAGLIRYGDTWRKHRRLYQQGFRPDAVLQYLPIQSSKTSEFISNLHEDPVNFMAHIRTLAAATILATIYGYDISPKNDYYVDLAEKAVGHLSEELGSPAAAIINILPVLRHLPPWLPIFRFQRCAAVCQNLVNQMMEVPFEYVKSNMRSGTGKPSLLATFLEHHEANGGDEDQAFVIKGVSATGYGAGADTTVVAIETFFLAMGINPDVQKKAQLELDNVIGRGRAPDYEDRPHLPYIEAVFRETLRWSPSLPMSAFRAAFTDDMIDGYYIPKGE
ncbi:hypothetical protein V5O48_012840 [Marasmius crinis-equi]|uniref:Cytochrome P450 n=1 Tax=Marasmius crinis-equi TaxID=585013 RepID=A0ABR3F1Q4_9AGAR